VERIVRARRSVEARSPSERLGSRSDRLRIAGIAHNGAVPRAAVLLLVLLTASCASWRDVGERFGGGTQGLYHAKVMEGDDARWAAVRCADCERWPLRLLPGIDAPARTFWARLPVTIPRELAAKPVGVYISFLAETDVYWDGERIGHGSAIDNLFVVRATPGEHLLAVRVAPHPDAAHVAWYGGIAVGDYAHMARSRIVSQIVPLSGMGLFVAIGIYFVVLSRAGERRAPLLVFAILCFASSLLVVVETWRWVFGYAAGWHLPRLQAIAALTLVVALLLVLFFALELRPPRMRVWLALSALAIAVSFALETTYDGRCFAAMRAAVVCCAAMTAASWRRPLRDLLPLALGVAILGAALIAGFGFGDSLFFLAFAAFIVLLLVSLAVRADHDRRRRETAELRAARLEIELLKRSIQPHFLMNTITAVMEWIEENPQEGVRFLEALGSELRMFGEIASERVVPLSRELELCRAHLELMGARMRTRFTLETHGVDLADAVPPAIFHTLIENAMTHNRYGEEDVRFELSATESNGTRRYEFDAPVRGAARSASRDGVGLRYLKARLEEAFPGRWRVDAEGRGEVWRTVIEVRP
jgi:hypothetical protein